MKKIFLLLILPAIILGGGLVTGQNIKFIPGDKVLFSEDFSKCPVGEIPTNFDKINGSWECVKYNNHIWLAPNSNLKSDVFKIVNLGDDNFEIDFHTIGLKSSGFIDFKMYDSNNTKSSDILRLSYSAQYCEFSIRGTEVFYHKRGCRNKEYHIAVQIRRKQLRIFINNKRVLNKLWELKNVKMIAFHSEGQAYNYIINNIRIAKYSVQETIPKPESVGIRVQKINGGEKLTVPEKVLFNFNKFRLKPEAKKALKVVSAYIVQNNPKKIVITGYTDNIGSDEYNLKLSLQRAQSVADFLIYCGKIDASKIEIKGLGKENPIVPNDTKENQAKNRRVEIKLI